MTKQIIPAGIYDADTGKQIIVLKFSCPKYSFWRIGHYEVIDDTYTHLKDIPNDSD